MRTQAVGAMLGNLAVLSLAVACERVNSPADPAASSVAASSRISASSAHPRIAANAEREEGGCTNASLEGAYGFVRTGTTSTGPLAAVGLVTYDGAGTWVATGTVSQDGAVTFDARTTGTYVLEADCTGKLLSSGQETGLLDLVERGTTVLLLSEGAGDAVSEVQKRVGLHSCTNASLEGAFGFVRTGTRSTGHLAALGFATYDGSGKWVARQLTSQNGVFVSNPSFSGTYELGADCQGKGFMANGQEFFRFVVVDGGNELVQISETPGIAVTGDQQRVNRRDGGE